MEEPLGNLEILFIFHLLLKKAGKKLLAESFFTNLENEAIARFLPLKKTFFFLYHWELPVE